MNFKIRLGPAGNCQTAKKPGWEASLERLAEIKLQAQEVQYVHGVTMSNQTALLLGKKAKQLGIQLSVHAPYFINLASHDKKIIKESKQRIVDSLERAHYMGARIVVVHPGYYGEHGEKAHDIILEQCQQISDYISSNKWKVLLGLETTGKTKQYGTLDEILDICKKVKHCAPVIDFAHLFAKQGGTINYSAVLDRIKHYDHIHSHFSNMKKNKAGGYSDIHMVLDSAPPFEPLAKEILKRKIDITIISETPMNYQDALKMKKIFEKLGRKFT